MPSILPSRHQRALPLEKLILEEAPGAEAIEMDVLFVGAPLRQGPNISRGDQRGEIWPGGVMSSPLRSLEPSLWEAAQDTYRVLLIHKTVNPDSLSRTHGTVRVRHVL